MPTAGLYVFACGARHARWAERCVASFRAGGFAGRVVVVCHSWEADYVSTFAEARPLPRKLDGLFYSQLASARHAKINPWLGGLTWAEDYILCVEPDVLLTGAWSDVAGQLDGRLHFERRDAASGSRGKVRTYSIGTGVVAMPNKPIARTWVAEATRLYRRDADAAVAGVGKIGLANAAAATFAGTYDHAGPWLLTHYHGLAGKAIFDAAAPRVAPHTEARA